MVCSIAFAVSNNIIPCMCWSVSVGLKLWFCVCCLCPRILNTWLHVCVMWLLSCCYGKYIQMKSGCVVGERKWNMKCWDLDYGGTLWSLVVVIFNRSAWSDEHCSSWRKHHLSWSDEHCSSWCTLLLIHLYLDNIGSKCNRAALCLFVKELALLWCGRQLLEIIS